MLQRDRETGVDTRIGPWDVSLLIHIELRAAILIPCYHRSLSESD